MAHQFIYHMHGLSKAYPGNRKVLDDIHLSFYPDAKIGVLGVNGAGKSTLLRLMAGFGRPQEGGFAWQGEAVGAAAELHRAHEGVKRSGSARVVPTTLIRHASHATFSRKREKDTPAGARRIAQ